MINKVRCKNKLAWTKWYPVNNLTQHIEIEENRPFEMKLNQNKVHQNSNFSSISLLLWLNLPIVQPPFTGYQLAKSRSRFTDPCWAVRLRLLLPVRLGHKIKEKIFFLFFFFLRRRRQITSAPGSNNLAHLFLYILRNNKPTAHKTRSYKMKMI